MAWPWCGSQQQSVSEAEEPAETTPGFCSGETGEMAAFLLLGLFFILRGALKRFFCVLLF